MWARARSLLSFFSACCSGCMLSCMPIPSSATAVYVRVCVSRDFSSACSLGSTFALPRCRMWKIASRRGIMPTPALVRATRNAVIRGSSTFAKALEGRAARALVARERVLEHAVDVILVLRESGRALAGIVESVGELHLALELGGTEHPGRAAGARSPRRERGR